MTCFEVEDPLDTRDISCILKRGKAIRHKAKRVIATHITERRFQQKRSKRIECIQNHFPICMLCEYVCEMKNWHAPEDVHETFEMFQQLNTAQKESSPLNTSE